MKTKGLLPHRFDFRDLAYRRHKLNSQQDKYGSVGLPPVPSLPATYRAQGVISDNDQGDSNLCTCYATAALGERLDGKAYSREYMAKCESEILGYNMADKGCDLRTALSIPCKRGFLEKSKAPVDWKKQGAQYAANPSNWPLQADVDADLNIHPGYVWITGPYDNFDNMRAHLVDMAPVGTISVGTRWYDEWETYLRTPGNDGILPMPVNPTQYTFHDSILSGYQWQKSKIVLVDESWQGNSVGDNGLVYFTRDVFNFAMSTSDTSAATLELIGPNDISAIKLRLLAILQILLEYGRSLVNP